MGPLGTHQFFQKNTQTLFTLRGNSRHSNYDFERNPLNEKRRETAGTRECAEHPAAAVAQHQLQRALLLDIVVSEGAAVLQLLAREDEALLVGRDCPPCSGVPAAASLHTKSVISHACY